MNANPKNRPNISVVMSCYNAERWLHESIRSITSQLLDDFEFIIVNDGSDDRTREILEQESAIDQRIRVIDKANTGLADSLNVAISSAVGHWIARIDADDVSSPERLLQQYRYVKDHPDVIFVGSSLSIINEFGKESRSIYYPEDHESLHKRLVGAGMFPPHSSAFFHAGSFHTVGGYRPRIRRAEDKDLWLRLSMIGKLACVPSVLVKVRKHSSNISNEESGVRQYVDSTIATMSYLLIREKKQDPVDLDDCSFHRFYTWTESQLIDKDFMLMRALLETLRRNESFLSRIVLVLFSLTNQRLALKFFWFRYLQPRYVYNLSLRWDRKRKEESIDRSK